MAIRAGSRSTILDLRTGDDQILPGPKGQSGGVFSPDGTKIAYLRGVNGDLIQLVVAPVDRSNDGIPLGKAAGYGPDGPTINNYSWTADDTDSDTGRLSGRARDRGRCLRDERVDDPRSHLRLDRHRAAGRESARRRW